MGLIRLISGWLLTVAAGYLLLVYVLKSSIKLPIDYFLPFTDY